LQGFAGRKPLDQLKSNFGFTLWSKFCEFELLADPISKNYGLHYARQYADERLLLINNVRRHVRARISNVRHIEVHQTLVKFDAKLTVMYIANITTNCIHII
jgi:hypothetical protein